MDMKVIMACVERSGLKDILGDYFLRPADVKDKLSIQILNQSEVLFGLFESMVVWTIFIKD
jgi:hypothetical protein